jgi:hypothetical protein
MLPTRFSVSVAAALAFASPAWADEPAPVPSGAAAMPSGTPQATPPRGVIVELQANDGRATIERRVGTTSLAGMPFTDVSFASVGHWAEECIAPCEVKLDPRYSYRVGGEGLTPSGSFALPRDKDRVHLAAEMGSSSARLAGILLTGLGVGTTLLGGTALVLTPIFENQDVGSKTFRSAVLVGGVAFVAVGVLEMGMGLYLWATNGSSVRADHGVLSAKSATQPRLTPGGLVF